MTSLFLTCHRNIDLSSTVYYTTQTEVVLSLVGLGYAGEIDLDLN